MVPRGHRWTLDISADYVNTWFQSVMVIPTPGEHDYTLGLTLLSAQGAVAEYPGELSSPHQWVTITLIPHMFFDLGGDRQSTVYINVDDRSPELSATVNAIGFSGILVDNNSADDDPLQVTVWFIGPEDRIVPADVGP
jgi:hypothetical protein